MELQVSSLEMSFGQILTLLWSYRSKMIVMVSFTCVDDVTLRARSIMNAINVLPHSWAIVFNVC